MTDPVSIFAVLHPVPSIVPPGRVSSSFAIPDDFPIVSACASSYRSACPSPPRPAAPLQVTITGDGCAESPIRSAQELSMKYRPS